MRLRKDVFKKVVAKWFRLIEESFLRLLFLLVVRILLVRYFCDPRSVRNDLILATDKHGLVASPLKTSRLSAATLEPELHSQSRRDAANNHALWLLGQFKPLKAQSRERRQLRFTCSAKSASL